MALACFFSAMACCLLAITLFTLFLTSFLISFFSRDLFFKVQTLLVDPVYPLDPPRIPPKSDVKTSETISEIDVDGTEEEEEEEEEPESPKIEFNNELKTHH